MKSLRSHWPTRPSQNPSQMLLQPARAGDQRQPSHWRHFVSFIHSFIHSCTRSFISFHFISFHSFTHFIHSIPFHSIPSHPIPSHSIPFHSIPFHSFHSTHSFVHACIHFTFSFIPFHSFRFVSFHFISTHFIPFLSFHSILFFICFTSFILSFIRSFMPARTAASEAGGQDSLQEHSQHPLCSNRCKPNSPCKPQLLSMAKHGRDI